MQSCLSPSTEVYDKGEKFARYQELASLRLYVKLVSQNIVQGDYLSSYGDTVGQDERCPTTEPCATARFEGMQVAFAGYLRIRHSFRL